MVDFFLKGGKVMWPLLLCSIVSVMVIVERALFWLGEGRSAKRSDPEKMLDAIEACDFEQAQILTDAHEHHLARVLNFGLRHRGVSLSNALEIAAGIELKRMRRFLPILDTIITMAPLLGILGTVMGIIDSFNILGQSGIDDPKKVTGGIAVALITTATGLAVALVALVPYNYFLSRMDDASHDIERYATALEIADAKSQPDEEEREPVAIEQKGRP